MSSKNMALMHPPAKSSVSNKYYRWEAVQDNDKQRQRSKTTPISSLHNVGAIVKGKKTQYKKAR